MINKFQKIINNKFSGFLKFVFFLRYLVLIFLLSMLFFLYIPQFFDYKKKEAIIKNYISENYGLHIKTIESIKYRLFPLPNLEISNLTSDFYNKGINLKTESLVIYPEILSIYNYSNFNVRKTILENNNIETDIKNLKFLSKNIFFLKKKLFIKNLDLTIKDKNKKIINLNNVDFINYGYKKNIINGEVFNKKFRVKLNNDFTNIDLKLLKTGVSSKIKIFEKGDINNLKGNLKGKILKSNFKLDFSYDNQNIKFSNFYFRDKKFSFNSDGSLELKPFFKVNLNTNIKNIDVDILKKLDINKLLKHQDLIKQLNSELKITFKSKKFEKNLIREADIKTALAYGELNFSKNLLISNSNFKCNSYLNLLDEYPIYYFHCLVNSPNKKKLLKYFKINYKGKDKNLDLSIRGSLNILNNKINLDSLEFANNYKATDDDLKYYKSKFENIIFDENFIKIFDLLKIKKFIYEIL